MSIESTESSNFSRQHQVRSFTGGIAATNGFLLTSGEAALVVDAPEGMHDWLAEQGDLKLDALLLTHAHFDHVLDAAAIGQTYGCPIYAFAEATPELTLEVFLGAIGGSYAVSSYQVDHLLAEGDPLCIGGIGLEVKHLPGHSLDSLVFISKDLGIVFGGDVLMAGGIGRSDFPGGSADLLVHGIREKLYHLPHEMIVHAGHGPDTTIGHEKATNPFTQA